MSTWYGNSFNTYGSTPSTDHRLGIRRGKPTYSDIIEAATAAVRVFDTRGIPICAVGGLACKLFGNARVPNDVDLLLLDTVSSQEELKRILVSSNPSFYLVPARSPLATYKVLWYRTNFGIRVKVDLLQPGIMSIPNFPPDRIKNISYLTRQIPVAPFGLVLLLKLQAWVQHRESSEYRYYEKHYNDSRDLNTLLPIAATQNVVFDYLPDGFLSEARQRARSYYRLHPDTRSHWKGLKIWREETKIVPPSRDRAPVYRPRPTLNAGDLDLLGSFRRMRINDPYRGQGSAE